MSSEQCCREVRASVTGGSGTRGEVNFGGFSGRGGTTRASLVRIPAL